MLWVASQQDTVGFLVTTKHVEEREQLKWFHKQLSDKAEISASVALTRAVDEHRLQQHHQSSKTFSIDMQNMNKAQRLLSSGANKLLEQLESYNDNFECRQKKKMGKESLEQDKARAERHARRSADHNSAQCNLPDLIKNNDFAVLGYAEMTWASIFKIVSRIHENLGATTPACFLDIGSGTTAHLVITASASGRFFQCDGIEISSARFQASQKAKQSAETNGILKSECRIIHGDVLTSTDIHLDQYNVYSFFDKVCIEVSQMTLQKVIMAHFSSDFAHGPVLYFTCMLQHELESALHDAEQSMPAENWNQLFIDHSNYLNVSTRFDGQTFKCTLVRVGKKT
jgi:hypothetical protein